MRSLLCLASLALCFACLPASAQIFEDVAPELGVDITTPFGDVFAVDYSGDLLNDLLFTSRYDGTSMYFRNTGEGFEQLDIGLPDGNFDGWKFIPMDFDQDRDIDLAISCYHYSMALMVNENGQLVDRTGELNLPTYTSCRDLAWIDYDHDGWMDLLLGYAFYGWKLYRNNHGSFVNVTDQSMLPSTADFHRFCEADVDLDGNTDLFMTTMHGEDFFYYNIGGGVFEDRSISSGLIDAVGRGGCLWADFDNDKYPDLLTGGNDTHTIWHNNGNLTFTEMIVHGMDVIFDVYANAAHYAAGDYDLDGDLDIYAGQPDGGYWGEKVNQFFRCDSILGLDIYFTDIAPELGMDLLPDTKPHFFDYDQDGDLDLFLRMYGVPSRLYRNNLNPQNFFLVDVRGPNEEKDCWLTRVEVYEHGTDNLVLCGETNYGGARRDGLCHYLTLDPNTPYDFRIYFADQGVMTPDNFPELSGIIPAEENRKITVLRGVGVLSSPELEPPVVADFSAIAYPNPFNSEVSLKFSLSNASDVTVRILDLQGREVAALQRDHLAAGLQAISWNATGYATGLYFADIRAGAQRDVVKMVLLK